MRKISPKVGEYMINVVGIITMLTTLYFSILIFH